MEMERRAKVQGLVPPLKRGQGYGGRMRTPIAVRVIVTSVRRGRARS